MAILLITFNETSMELRVDSFACFLAKYKHVRISKSSYVIETDEQTRTVFNKILPYLSNNAHLFIVAVMQPFTFQGVDHVKEWLRKHLPEE